MSAGTGFNPRARTGRDGCASVFLPIGEVSIHAPARGATTLGPEDLLVFLFQSTRPHGARLSCTREKPLRGSFNPRARTGRDGQRGQCRQNRSVSIHAPARGATSDHARRQRAEDVSIHAPARGATSGRPRACWPRSGFNPRARTGRDVIEDEIRDQYAKFQSTRPHGARRAG